MRSLTPILSSRQQSMMSRKVRSRITRMEKGMRVIVRCLRVERRSLTLDVSRSKCVWMTI